MPKVFLPASEYASHWMIKITFRGRGGLDMNLSAWKILWIGTFCEKRVGTGTLQIPCQCNRRIFGCLFRVANF